MTHQMYSFHFDMTYIGLFHHKFIVVLNWSEKGVYLVSTIWEFYCCWLKV